MASQPNPHTDSDLIIVSDDGFGDRDELEAIEIIVGSRYGDTFDVNSAHFQLMDGLILDGGPNIAQQRDIINANLSVGAIAVNLDANGAGTIRATNGTGTIFLQNFKGAEINGTQQKDIIKTQADHLIINAGGGDDVIHSEGRGVKVFAGGGTNQVTALGYGSIVNVSGGQATVHAGTNLQINGLGHNDRIEIGDKVLTGGYGALSSEKATVRGKYGEEYGFNDKGDLVIIFGGRETFVTGAKSGPDVAEPTANITIFKMGYDAFLTFRGDRAGAFMLDWLPKTLDLIA